MADEKKARKRKGADREGSIFKRSDGLWIGRVMVGAKPDGKPDIRQVSAKTQGLCRERLHALKSQATNGTLASIDTAGMTVAAFLDRWLASVKPNLREKTYRGYSQHVALHYKPALGSKRLSKLTHTDVEDFLNAKRDETRNVGKRAVKLSPRSIHALYVVLGTALNWGVRKGYIPFSPMLRVDAPRVPSTEITPLTPEQTAHLLSTAVASGDPLSALWTLSAFTGARKSELLGLEWRDVDLEAGRLTIRPNSVRDVKTPRSRRTLDLAEDAVAALVAHQDRQTFQRSALGEAYSDRGLVFASDVGTPLDHDNVTKRFKKALKAAGLPSTTRLHDLRHGAATMLLEAGETVPTVAEYLGHASPAVTMAVYAHAVPGSKKRAADRLGAILRGAQKAPETAAEDAAAAG